MYQHIEYYPNFMDYQVGSKVPKFNVGTESNRPDYCQRQLSGRDLQLLEEVKRNITLRLITRSSSINHMIRSII